MDERETCQATKPIQIGNQIPQTARCILPPHPASQQHKALVLDSDDNWIPEYWRGEDRG